MTTIREFSEPDFDDLVALWHETNLRSYPYVQAHQEHTLSDARQFFRASVLVECRVWVAASSRELQGLLALRDSWIRQLADFVGEDEFSCQAWATGESRTQRLLKIHMKVDVLATK